MRKLSVFNQVSVDGYFRTPSGDIGWLHKPEDDDPDFADFTESNASQGGVLLFGRVTYEVMVSFWPTPAAAQQFPAVAKRMNELPKIVFSRTLNETSWKNTRLVKGDLVSEVKSMKSQRGDDMVILGSGQIVSQLAQSGLIDEYQVVVFPVVLGAGRTMFDGITKPLDLKLTKTRAFRNGKVFLVYQRQER